MGVEAVAGEPGVDGVGDGGIMGIVTGVCGDAKIFAAGVGLGRDVGIGFNSEIYAGRSFVGVGEELVDVVEPVVRDMTGGVGIDNIDGVRAGDVDVDTFSRNAVATEF